MTIAALSWPAAAIWIAVITAVALVVAVLVHSLFRTGQAAIQGEGRERS
jgi:hypothetical protein